MPKLFGKDIPPVMLGAGVLVVIVLVVQATSSPDDTASKAKRPKSQPKSSLVQTDYLNTDYTFQIAPLPATQQPKDVFRPLVSKNTISGKDGNLSIDNFTYSGMAVLNGVANGLLENNQTGQGDFVQAGQSWHDRTIVKVSADSIELRDVNGDAVTLLAGVSSSKTGPSASAAAPAAAPAASGNPMMVGPIGSSDVSIQADAGANTGQGNGRRRRGRNRGGGASDGN